MERSEQNPPALAWAAYLGASWTWCIGMFLPVLLIRDYGAWAWVIFAVPNCLGAAAMGWVMRSGDQSRAFVRQHGAACRLFSLVTIAFQFFFSLWILPRLAGVWGYVGVAIIAQAAFIYLPRRFRVLVAPAVLLVSAAMFVGMQMRGALALPEVAHFAPADAIGLALVCLLGFLACPYLDLTFHRARQRANNAGSKIAFGVGFCGYFLLMILFTLLYATNFYRLAGIAAGLLAIHYIVQLTYTVNLHQAELIEGADDLGLTRGILGFALAVGLVAGLAAQFAQQNDLMYHGLTIGEVIYRLFMAFYGLVFPAYVLLAIGCTPSPGTPGEGRGEGSPLAAQDGPSPLPEYREREHPVSLGAWLVIVLIASPFYWLAFIEARMAWASAGVGIVVAGALLARFLTPRATAAPRG